MKCSTDTARESSYGSGYRRVQSNSPTFQIFAHHADSRPMTARLIRPISALLLVAAIAVTGCGGGGSATAANGSTGAPITKAQAVAYAGAVNLRASDLPQMLISAP